MASKAFIGMTIVLWLGSMSWLISEKVMPSFYERSVPVAAGREADVPIAWQVEWAGEQVGYSASVMRLGVQGTTEIHNHIDLRDVPLLDLAPALMRNIVSGLGKLRLTATTRLEFDSLENFSAFESSISVNEVAGIIKLNGRMKGSSLHVKIHSAGSSFQDEIRIRDQSALNEALFPRAELPYLYNGKGWQEEVYNPFANPNDPIDTIDAEVVGEERLQVGEEQVRVFCIEYRSIAAAGVSDKARLRAKAWVEPLGKVLKQDVYLANAMLSFRRVGDEQANEIGSQYFQWLEGRKMQESLKPTLPQEVLP